jgi:hypothetical protein
MQTNGFGAATSFPGAAPRIRIGDIWNEVAFDRALLARSPWRGSDKWGIPVDFHETSIAEIVV